MSGITGKEVVEVMREVRDAGGLPIDRLGHATGTAPFNRLSPAEVEVLACLAEEAGEIVQAVGKILRHGFESRSPLDLDDHDNRGALERELGGLTAIVRIAIEADLVNRRTINHHAEEKARTIGRWLHHAKAPYPPGRSTP